MAAIYANENFPQRVVEALREIGHDVLTSQEADRASFFLSPGLLRHAPTTKGLLMHPSFLTQS